MTDPEGSKFAYTLSAHDISFAIGRHRTLTSRRPSVKAHLQVIPIRTSYRVNIRQYISEVIYRVISNRRVGRPLSVRTLLGGTSLRVAFTAPASALSGTRSGQE